jgi:hypothetical protein
MTDKTTARRLTAVLSSAALLGLTACGGGSGGDLGAVAPSADSGSTPAIAAPAPVGGTDTAAAPVQPGQDTGAAVIAPAPPVIAQPAPLPAPAPSAAPAPAPATGTAPSAAAPQLADCEMFPSNAIFNTRIDDTSRFPADPQSWNWITMAGANLPFFANWGTSSNPADSGNYWGIPINVVDGTSATTNWPVVSFDFSTSGLSWEKGYPFKSDCAVADGNGWGVARDCTSVPTGQTHFPFPLDSKLVSENGLCNDPNRCGDRHVLVVETGACRLWESFFSYQLNGRWYSMATAAWDLNSNQLRPDDWASGDAAGLPIAPLLAKASEADSGEIRHALRVSFRDAALALQHVWPARFAAGGDNPGAIPFGSVLRLRADFVIPGHWTTQAKAIATAAKRYGLYVADNGPDFYIQGEPSSAWDPLTSQQLKAISLANMEFVNLNAIKSDPRFSPDSMAASW